MSVLANLVLLGVVLAVHTLVVAVMTRFFRLRLETRWGAAIYTAFLVPVVLLASTQLFTGALGIGVDLGDPRMALAVMIGLPLALGVTLDVLYMAPPEEYELPDTTGG